MGFVILGVCLYWTIGSVVLSYRTGKQLIDLGTNPWARGWYSAWIFRLLPDHEQAIYDRFFKRQILLILSGGAFVILAILVTGSW